MLNRPSAPTVTAAPPPSKQNGSFTPHWLTVVWSPGTKPRPATVTGWPASSPDAGVTVIDASGSGAFGSKSSDARAVGPPLRVWMSIATSSQACDALAQSSGVGNSRRVRWSVTSAENDPFASGDTTGPLRSQAYGSVPPCAHSVTTYRPAEKPAPVAVTRCPATSPVDGATASVGVTAPARTDARMRSGDGFGGVVAAGPPPVAPSCSAACAVRASR